MDRCGDVDLRQILRGDPAAILAEEESVVFEHPEHLLEEQRVAARGLGDPLCGPFLESVATQDRRDQFRALFIAERSERQRARVRGPASPRRPRVHQVGPRQAEQQDRDVVAPASEVLDQVEEGRLGPLEVVDGRRRAAGRERACSRNRRIAQKVSWSPAAVDAKPVTAATRSAISDAVLGALDRRIDLGSCLVPRVVVGDRARLLHDLRDGPERDAVAVRQTPGRKDER